MSYRADTAVASLLFTSDRASASADPGVSAGVLGASVGDLEASARDGKASGAALQTAEVIEALASNSVPTAVVGAMSMWAVASDAAELQAYMAADRGRLEYQSAAYSEVDLLWKEKDVDAVLIKSPGYFPYTSSNVDALVSEDKWPTAISALERLGYRELKCAREPFKLLFRRVVEPYLGFAIHLHSAVGWISPFVDGADVIASSEHDPAGSGFAFPSAEHVALITSAHWLYEDKALSLRDLYHLVLAARRGLDWERVRRAARAGGWEVGLDLAISFYAAAGERFGIEELTESATAGRASRRPSIGRGGRASRQALVDRYVQRACDGGSFPLEISKVAGKGLHLLKSLRDPRLDATQTAAELYRVSSFAVRAKLPPVRRGPFFAVSISGPDGAGKTTLARSLQTVLEQEIGLSVSYRWMRVGSSSALDGLRSLARGSRKGTGVARGLPRDHSALRQYPWLEVGWRYLTMTDVVTRFWMSRIRYRLAGGVYILDRDALDAAVDLDEMYGFSRSSAVRAASPSPSLQVLIVAGSPDQGEDAPDSVSVGRYLALAQDADVLITERSDVSLMAKDIARAVMHDYVL
jgi:energy-coupling factor transporter ATP-binding protein EcfA2